MGFIAAALDSMVTNQIVSVLSLGQGRDVGFSFPNSHCWGDVQSHRERKVRDTVGFVAKA